MEASNFLSNNKRYNIEVKNYTETQRIEITQKCNGLSITNTGDCTATIEGILLYPGVPGTSQGDSISFGGNEGEILIKKQLVLTFPNPLPNPNPSIQIIFKYFI